MVMEPSSSMNPSTISTISKKMESMSMTDRVVRNNKKLPQSRYSPYTAKIKLTTEKQKDESLRLGVELSLFVAEAMFLLSDDIHSMLLFCYLIIFECTGNKDKKNSTQVVKRLICVMLYMFETYIKPKNGVYKDDGKSTQFELINSSTEHFVYGVRNLERIVLVLNNGGLMPQSDFEHFNQELKKLEEKLRFSKEANGFAREAIQSNIIHLWDRKSPVPPKIINAKIIIGEMFRPLLNQAMEYVCSSLVASLHIWIRVS